MPFVNFGKLLILFVFNKVYKYAVPPLFNDPEVLSFAYAEADLFPKLFDSFSTCFPF